MRWTRRFQTVGRDVLQRVLIHLKIRNKSVISSVELKEIKEKNEALRKIVLPELELLYSQIAGTNFYGRIFR